MAADLSPIVIAGIRPRCGTNYLCDLINLHPDVSRPGPIYEDYFLAHADKLEAFADAVGRHWSNLTPPAPESATRDVLSALGVGLMGWLTALAGGGRVLTKTPVPGRLDLFFKTFPAAKLLIVVRDGRAVVESHMRSWPGDGRFGDDLFAGLAQAWADGADIIQSFRQCHPLTEYPYMLVRYEDLVSDPADMIGRILDFLALDRAVYSFTGAVDMPVRGSSTFGRAQGTPLHWTPVQKDPSFDPLKRWSHWTTQQHKTFNRIAGAQMKGFGYSLA